jgi:hypothetical protein
MHNVRWCGPGHCISAGANYIRLTEKMLMQGWQLHSELEFDGARIQGKLIAVTAKHFWFLSQW